MADEILRYEVLTGQRFGRWTVLGPADPPRKPDGTRLWRCRCACGRELVRTKALLRRHAEKCLCNRDALTAARNRTHGLSKHPLYTVWCGMIQRCTNPRSIGWKDYGGKGITLCEKWRRSFPAFLADMGERPSNLHELDRIDSKRGYEPGNVRWATPSENARNRRSNHLLTAFGRTMTLTDWCEETGIGYAALSERVARGWDGEKAVSTPVRPMRRPRSR